MSLVNHVKRLRQQGRAVSHDLSRWHQRNPKSAVTVQFYLNGPSIALRKTLQDRAKSARYSLFASC